MPFFPLWWAFTHRPVCQSGPHSLSGMLQKHSTSYSKANKQYFQRSVSELDHHALYFLLFKGLLVGIFNALNKVSLLCFYLSMWNYFQQTKNFLPLFSGHLSSPGQRGVWFPLFALLSAALVIEKHLQTSQPRPLHSASFPLLTDHTKERSIRAVFASSLYYNEAVCCFLWLL